MTLQPPFHPRAVVFDLDGLLLDSEPVWAAAEAEVVVSYGRTWRSGMQQLLLGKGPQDAARALARQLGDDDVEEVERRLRAASVKHFRHGVAPRPGAARLVGALAGRLPLGVATNSRQELATIALESSGLAACFDTVVTADDVVRPKPAPEAYAQACERLGADPSRSVALEDSPIGVLSAIAAGLWVIGCPSFPDQRLDSAHVVVSSLADIDPAILLAAA